MKKELFDELKSLMSGEMTNEPVILKKYSHDTSLFEVEPQAVVFPKNQDDLKKLIKLVAKNKKDNPDLSITGSSA